MGAKLLLAVSLGLGALASGLVLGIVPTESLGVVGRTASVGNIMRSLSTFTSRGLGPSELQDMEGAIKQLLMTEKPDKPTKEAIAQMKMIVDTFIPTRKAAQAKDQKYLDKQYETINNCAVLKKNTLAGDMPFDSKNTYKAGVAKHKDCVRVAEAKKLLKDAYCHKVDEAKLCTGKIAPENQKCCGAHAAHQVKHAECVRTKATLKSNKEHQEVILKQVCAKYDACYKRRVKAYAVVEKRVKANEKGRSWESLYRIKCLLDLYESKGDKLTKAESKACETKKHNVPKVTYRKVPAKESCSTKAFLQVVPAQQAGKPTTAGGVPVKR